MEVQKSAMDPGCAKNSQGHERRFWDVCGTSAYPQTAVIAKAPSRANSCQLRGSKGLNLFDKVVGANGTLETEEGPPGLGGPPSTCSRTYFSAEPATSRATADRPVDKSYCRRANDKAASVALASQAPISPSSMPAFPTLHSSCHRRRNATQWVIQFVRAVTSQGRGRRLS